VGGGDNGGRKEIKKTKNEKAKSKRKRKGKYEEKRNKKKKRKGYYGHFTILSTLHSQEKLFCKTFS
jgi:hypothetical protein